MDGEAQIDAVLFEDLGERIADLGRLAVGEPIGALDERDPRAEAGEELRQLDADRASSSVVMPTAATSGSVKVTRGTAR